MPKKVESRILKYTHTHIYTPIHSSRFPKWLTGKESSCQTGDVGLIHGSGRAPGEGNGNLLQYSFLGNPIDREAWWAPVHRVSKSQTQLSD